MTTSRSLITEPAPSFWAEQDRVIDSPPILRARPEDGRHDQLGIFQTALLGRITQASTDSHCTLRGARMSPNRCSTHCTIMSLIISPEMPAVVATQLMTSRSWLSRAKATRTISPFQQVNSSTSEHQRSLERLV